MTIEVIMQWLYPPLEAMMLWLYPPPEYDDDVNFYCSCENKTMQGYGIPSIF